MSPGRGRNSSGETPDTSNDEELARALQEQYRTEDGYQRSQPNSESNGTEGRASRSSGRDGTQSSQSSPRRSRSAQPDANSSRSDSQRSSSNPPSSEPRSEFAASFYGSRRPQRQRTIDATPSSTPTPKPRTSNATAATEDTSLNPTINSSSSDEITARLSQELSDEEYAKYLQRCEQARATQLNNSIVNPTLTSPQTVEEIRAEAAAQQRRDRRKARCKKYLPSAVFLVMTGIGLAVFFIVYDGKLNNLPDFPSLDDFWPDDDPYAGENDDPSSANKWSNTDNAPGLTLTILNALSNDWSDAFYSAVSDWDNAPPPNYDALTLTTSTTPYESECRPVRGQMKVCNGEYGDTNWRGINEVLIRRGVILSSVAKMNDTYLRRASEDQRRYTMCHEIGHGFGLPHTDEDFYNTDLGNCMDYTSNPKNNLTPNKMNYDFLAELYGYIGMNDERADDPVDDQVNDQVSKENDQVEDAGTRNRRRYSGEPEEEERDVGGSNRLRRIGTTLWDQQGSSEKEATTNDDEEASPEWNKFLSLVQISSLSPNLDDFMEKALDRHDNEQLPPFSRRDFQVTLRNKRIKWRTLHKQDKGEAYELELGNDYKYRLSALH